MVGQVLKQRLNNIVAIGTLDIFNQSFLFAIFVATTHDMVQDLLLLIKSAMKDALLDNIACELVPGKRLDIVQDQANHAITVGIISMFNDMLSDVVSKRIHDQIWSAFGKLLKDRALEDFILLLKHALNYAATKGVDRVIDNLAIHSVINELNIWTWNDFNGLLNDMITMLVSKAFRHTVLGVKLSHKLGLLVCEDVIESLT
jgi:hypothetical protein